MDRSPLIPLGPSVPISNPLSIPIVPNSLEPANSASVPDLTEITTQESASEGSPDDLDNEVHVPENRLNLLRLHRCEECRSFALQQLRRRIAKQPTRCSQCHHYCLCHKGSAPRSSAHACPQQTFTEGCSDLSICATFYKYDRFLIFLIL